MSGIQLNLIVLDGDFAVSRLAPQERIPQWVPEAGFVSVTRTADEISIVCPAEVVPDGVKSEGDFTVLKIDGPLDFSLTGILLAVARPLADAGISIFALSTYDTDYVLVRTGDLAEAVPVLRAFGHRVR